MKTNLYFGSENVLSCNLKAHQAKTFDDLITALLSKRPQLRITREQFQASDKRQRDKIKRQLPYLTACTFPTSPWKGGRTKANARLCNLIFLDVDDHQEAEKLRQLIADSNSPLCPYNFAIYKTISFTQGKPRLRIIVEAQAIPPVKYPQAVQTLAAHFGLIKVDACSETYCQPMLVPCLFQGEDPDLEYAFIHIERNKRAFTEADIMPLAAAADTRTPSSSQGSDESEGLEHLVSKVPGYETAEDVKSVLDDLDPDMMRGEWFKVAAGIKHQLGEDGFALFDEWSAKSQQDNYNSVSTRKLWDSLKSQPHDRKAITFKTVLRMAKQAGYAELRKTTSSVLPRICSAADLIEIEGRKPRPQMLVNGLLHVGEKLLLAGASKSYKSWTLLDLAVSVCSGTSFWGFSTTIGPVLLLNYEIRPYFFAERLQKVLKAKDCAKPENLDVWNLRGHRAGFDQVLNELREILKTTKYALIIIDPLYSGLAGRNENDAAEMAAFMNTIEELTECGPAVALGHHFAKGNSAMRESLDRASGSGVFARDPDGIMTLNRHQEKNAFVAEFTLRNFPPVDRIGLRLTFPLLVPDDSLNVDMIKGAQVRKTATATVEELVEMIPAGGIRTADLKPIACKELGLGKSKFYELHKEAKARGLIQQSNGVFTRTQDAVSSPKLNPETEG